VKLRKWLVAARLPFLTGCLLPVAAATAAVWRLEGRLPSSLHALLALVGVALIHAGANLANDYFDHRSGADEANRFATPFSGGSRVIQDGLLSPRAVLFAALLCLAAGAACGIVLWLRTGLPLLVIGLVGIAVGWCYTAPPLRLAHHGLGELAVFVGFGLLPVLGAEYIQRGAFSWQVGWLAVPAGLLIVAVLWINEFPDLEADAGAGKRTLVVRLGTRRAEVGYELLVLGAYLSVGLAIALGWAPPFAAAVLLAAPLTARAVRILRAHHAEPLALIPAQAATIGQHALFLALLTAAYLAALL
jgi:1,4-dihydroxy-2-naphthoate polyprenyltransferase